MVEEEREYTEQRDVTFKIEDDKIEIYFQLSEEERDLLEDYIHDETFFDDEGSPPSFLVIRFRKKQK